MEVGEGFADKGSVEAGGAVGGDHGRLDGDGAGAAEGVPKERIFAGTGGEGDGSGKGLSDGGGARFGAVAALMEGRAAGVDHQVRHVLEDEEFDLIFDVTVLGEPFDAVVGGKTLNYGFFDNALAIGNREQLAFDGMTLDGELVVFADPILKGQSFCAVKELGKACGREGAEKNVDALGKAQSYIGAGNVGSLTLKGDATVHGVKAAET